MALSNISGWNKKADTPSSTAFVIRQNHCLHCGSCYEKCPVKAVMRR